VGGGGEGAVPPLTGGGKREGGGRQKVCAKYRSLTILLKGSREGPDLLLPFFGEEPSSPIHPYFPNGKKRKKEGEGRLKNPALQQKRGKQRIPPKRDSRKESEKNGSHVKER